MREREPTDGGSAAASYSIWVNYTRLHTTVSVIVRRGPTGSFVPYLGTGRALGSDVHYDNATPDFLNGGHLNPNAWYNIVVTHSNNSTVLYVNGQMRANSTTAGRLASTGTGSSTRFLMGATSHSASTQSEYFPGLLDDARVYNVALTAQEVSSLFTGSNVTRGLVSRWAFDQGLGTVANDTGGGSNNATLWPTNSPPTWSTNEP